MTDGPSEWRSIPGLAQWAATHFGDDEALVDGEIRLSFVQLAGEARRAARAMVTAGLRPGDRVAIWAPNMAEWEIALLGVQHAGGIAVPLNTRYKGTEAAYILNKSRARILLTVNGFLGNDYVHMLADQELPHLEQTIVLRGAPAEGAAPWAAFLDAGDPAVDPEVDRRLAATGLDDISDMVFTSGTTGLPKGVLTTHGQTLRAYLEWATATGVGRGDRYLLINPMFHTFGYKAGIVAALMAGATLLPVPVFDVDAALEIIDRERITVLPGPPTLYQSLLNSPKLHSVDVSSLRLAVTGAATVPVELIHRVREELGFESVMTAYGLTESCGIVTVCRPGDSLETIANTSGRPIPGVEVRIADGSGAALAPGEPGEVLVRGYTVMKGYFEDPEQTAEAIDADGWLHTGDIGIVDEVGNVAITDRKKDMFIVGGFNAYPAEIENLLLGNTKIAQVAVVGLPDDRLGEVGAAFVVLRHDATATPEEIIDWAKEHMANYKVPRRVEIVDHLPVNASGKVQKFELRSRAAGDRGATQ